MYVSFQMKNDTPNEPSLTFLREHPDLLIELLRDQNKIIQSLKDTIEKQTEIIGQLSHDVARLREQLDKTEREAHRQAAPFRVDERRRKAEPGKPGRPAGHAGSSRKKPDHVDQTIDVPLERCPRCGGSIHSIETVEQFIEELPPIRPTVFRILTRRACCPQCGAVASHHPLQTSDATGAAGVHLGPRALAAAVSLNRDSGLTMRKTCRVLERLFGLKLTPGGLTHAAHRLATRLGSAFDGLRAQVRTADVIHADETGWWLGGAGRQLWVFTNPSLTVYQVRASRGRDVVFDMLGDKFGGVLVSDCLATYDDATAVQHKCYSHHLKAVAKAVENHKAGGAGFLCDVKRLLKAAMMFKKLKPQIGAADWADIRASLKRRAAQLLTAPREDAAEEALANRLRKQQDHLFTFLDYDAVDATNNLAERQLRPAVIARKLSAGNKTERGARTWEILASLAATYAQRNSSFFDLLIQTAMLNHSATR